jgi:hypothetical protein
MRMLTLVRQVPLARFSPNSDVDPLPPPLRRCTYITKREAAVRTFDEFAEHWLTKLDEYIQTRIERAPRVQFPGNPMLSANLFVSSLGYKPIYDRWRNLAELDREYDDVKTDDYAGHLATTLHRDMVHSSFEMLSLSEARAAAEEFYSHFHRGQVTRLSNMLGGGSNPITECTFEAAYVAMDDDWIGLFLLEAED